MPWLLGCLLHADQPDPAPAAAGDGMVQGRTHGLRKRLKDLAEFVFVDAPHCLPAWSKAAKDAGEAVVADGAVRQQPEQSGQQQQQQQRGAPPRRAWMLTPAQFAAQQQQQQQPQCDGGESTAASAAVAAACMDEWQFQQQTAGWHESEQALAAVLREQGPFDGVLGFSQGAAVAAVLAAQQWQQQAEQQKQAGSGSDSCIEEEASPTQLQFAILCSGYRSAVPEHRQLLEAATAAGGVGLPSLHIYGAGGYAAAPVLFCQLCPPAIQSAQRAVSRTSCLPHCAGGDDRQISAQESAALAECFDPTQVCLRHHPVLAVGLLLQLLLLLSWFTELALSGLIPSHRMCLFQFPCSALWHGTPRGTSSPAARRWWGGCETSCFMCSSSGSSTSRSTTSGSSAMCI